MKTSLFRAGLACIAALAASAATAGPADPFDEVPTAPAGTLPNDLSMDAAFSGDGLQTIDFNDGFSNADVAKRVFPADGGGYWVVGVHGTGINEPPRAAIAKLLPNGNLDTSYNGGGRTVAMPMDLIEDVTQGPFQTLYFTGRYTHPQAGDLDFGVFCVDVDGDPCQGFGNNGFKSVSFDLGSGSEHHNDVPARIIYAFSNLYVGGSCGSGSGTSYNDAACVTKLSATTGALDSGFAEAGRYSRNFDFGGNRRDAVTDLLAYSPQAGQVRLVMIGDLMVGAPSDSDGFIASLDGISGQESSQFGGAGFSRLFFDLGSSRADHATRVIRRAGGGFVVAGYAVDDSASPAQEQMFLAAFEPFGSFDTRFGTNGTLHRLVLSGTNRPFALAERPRTGDLVVGLNARADLFGDGHPIATAVQFSCLGNSAHALTALDVPGNAGSYLSTGGGDLLIDGSDRVVVVGNRQWSGLDYDMVAARYIATDRIYADHFGSVTADH
jgi:hypothetical protein